MRNRTWVLVATIAVMAVLVIVAGVRVLVPVPALSLTTNLAVPLSQPGPASISWPRAREAAVTVDGFARTWDSGGQAEVPIASVTKMMTAYVVLRDHPLRGDGQGPSIPVTEEDAEAYEYDVEQDYSSAKVAAGHPLTERQALEALLLPSADNIADLLATWDAGSVRAFAAKMNAMARSLGMDHTDYTDPSGLAASTVSTALDQLTMMRTAMKVPAFAQIVAMRSATIPVAGVIRNYNTRIGTDGIIGVKTGTDEAAQGCWAFAIQRQVGGARRVVYGVVLGAPAPFENLAPAAVAAGVQIADAMPKTVRWLTVLPAGTAVGQVTVPWSKAPVSIVTARALSVLAVSGTHVSLDVQARVPGTARFSGGARVGEVSATGIGGSAAAPLVTTGGVRSPSVMWRLFR